MPATEGVSRELLSEHRILLPQVNFLTVSLKLQNLKLAESLEKKKGRLLKHKSFLPKFYPKSWT